MLHLNQENKSGGRHISIKVTEAQGDMIPWVGGNAEALGLARAKGLSRGERVHAGSRQGTRDERISANYLSRWRQNSRLLRSEFRKSGVLFLFLFLFCGFQFPLSLKCTSANMQPLKQCFKSKTHLMPP